MKKQLILSFALILCSAAVSFAAAITGSTTIGSGTYSPSNKVGINIVSTATSYGATSAHLSGTFQYGTGGGTAFTGDPTKILKKAYTAASDATVGAPDTPSATALPTGTWTD